MALTKIKTGGITDSAITTAKINNNAVTDAKVADAITVTGAQTGITQVGTLTSLTVDDITLNGSTISDSGDLTIDTEADLTLTALSDIIHQTTSTNSTAGHHIFKSYNTEIMRIDGGNNRVGIGTDSPAEVLHIYNSDACIRLENSGSTGVAEIYTNNQAGLIFDADPANGDNGTPIVFKTDGNEVMRCTNSGNVGIAQDTPTETVHIGNGGGGNYVMIQNASSGDYSSGFKINRGTSGVGMQLYDNPGDNATTLLTAGAFNLNANGSGLDFGIDTSGNATFAGSAKWGNPSTNNQGILIGSSGCPMEYYVSTTSGSNIMEFGNPNGGIGTILASGSGVTYNTSSDYRLKENEVAIPDGITRLKQLKPYRFNFKADADKTVDGFFAHEVSSIVPESVSGEKDAVDEDGEMILQGMDNARLVPLLVSALQEAIDRIETLENA